MSIDEVISNPAVQSAALPFLTAAIVTGLIRLLLGPNKGPWLSGAGIGIGIMVTYLVIIGVPAFPPLGSGQKVLYLFGIALFAGLVFDMDGNPKTLHRLCLLGFPVVGCAWLAGPRLQDLSLQSWDRPEVQLLALAIVVSWAVLGVVKRESQKPMVPVSLLIAGNLGIGGLAMLGGSASISQVSFALAAALGGFAVWNWPITRHAFGSAGLFVGAGGMMALVCQILFFTRIPAWPLAILLPILVLPKFVGRIPLAGLKGAEAIRPVILFALALVFVGISLTATYLRTEQGYGGY